MKRISAMWAIGIFLLVIHNKVKAQYVMQSPDAIIIRPFNLPVTFNKTTNLLFPYEIKKIDLGSNALIAQKPKGVDTALEIKAAIKNFEPTNVSVFTADGKLHSFLVHFAPETDSLNFYFGAGSSAVVPIIQPPNAATLKEDAVQAKQQKAFLNVKVHEQRVSLLLEGIWLINNTMWFDLYLKNNTLITYTPDYIRFFIRDRKRGKRTAVQETEIIPLNKLTNDAIAGRQANMFGFAFTPFTMPATQELVVQVGEKNGGRSLVLRVSHRVVLKARKPEK
jgi:conjugative transposon TraN protein